MLLNELIAEKIEALRNEKRTEAYSLCNNAATLCRIYRK